MKEEKEILSNSDSTGNAPVQTRTHTDPPTLTHVTNVTAVRISEDRISVVFEQVSQCMTNKFHS